MKRFAGYIQSIQIQTYDRAFVRIAEHLSTLLEAGVPLDAGIIHLESKESNPLIKKILAESIIVIRQGEPISTAWQPYVTPILLSLLHTGEACGQLPVVLNQYAARWREQQAWKSKIMHLLAYPSLLCLMTFGLFVYISSVVIPMFDKMYLQLGYHRSQDVEIVAVALKSIPNVAAGCFLFMLLVLIVLWMLSRKSVRIRSFLWSRVPGTGLFRMSRTRILASQLALLLGAGLPIIQSLYLLESAPKPRWLCRIAFMCRQGILLGKRLEDVFSGELDTILAVLLHGADMTGDLTSAFAKAEIYAAERLKKNIERFTKILEPALLLIMGGVVGLCMYAVFMPMYSFIGTLSSGNHL